jgi:hypothetical protein
MELPHWNLRKWKAMLKFVDFGMFIDANAALLQDKSA